MEHHKAFGNERRVKIEDNIVAYRAVARQQSALQWTGWKAVFSTGSAPMAAHATMDTTMRSDIFYTVCVEGLYAG
jgi:hypothetical protein